MPPRFGTVLFDLDGTVVDTVALIRESHRHAVRTVLGAEMSDEELTANVGRPLIDQMRAFSEEHAEALLVEQRAWNHAHTAELIAAYPGMDGLLGRLRDAGCRVGIVTSKSRPTVQLAFDALPDIARHLDDVVGLEDSATHKPGPEPVQVALANLGATPDDACYVGDAPFDIAAGNAAGVTTIGVTWGFFDQAALDVEHPDLVVHDIPALEAVLLGAAE
jgi:pyrophosphatase PpaX